jgi:ABC-2 type transport system permease protein
MKNRFRMKNLAKITFVETKLFFREPSAWMIALLLPTIVLLILGALPSLRTPQEVFGGQRFIDVFLPSLMVITVATLGVNTLPMRLAAQREKGVLRRLSTTPVQPALLLVAQLVINLALAAGAVLLLIVVGKMAFDTPLPQNGPGFLAAFLLGLSATFALGLLIAAAAPTARVGAALSMPLYFLVMFLGGAYLPRMFLPDFLVRLGEYSPPGVQALLDAWMGAAPDPKQLAVLALISLAAGAGAARSFRWE